MMQTDLFTDTLIQLMRDVFTQQEISSEQRARIYALIASNRSAETLEQVDFWGTSAIPSDDPTVEDTPEADEPNQLWLFRGF